MPISRFTQPLTTTFPVHESWNLTVTYMQASVSSSSRLHFLFLCLVGCAFFPPPGGAKDAYFAKCTSLKGELCLLSADNKKKRLASFEVAFLGQVLGPLKRNQG